MKITKYCNNKASLIATKDYLLIQSYDTIISYCKQGESVWYTSEDFNSDIWTRTSMRHYTTITGLSYKEVKMMDSKEFKEIINNI